MKRLLALILTLVLLLTGCTTNGIVQNTSTEADATESNNSYMYIPDKEIRELSFTGLNDPTFLQYYEDSVYSGIAANLASDDFVINTVSIKYLSKEYLEETAYNSQENIFFGYTLSDLDEIFGETKYVFSIGDDGQTVVQELVSIAEADYYDKIIKNVAIGAGVILVCVVITVATDGAGAPAAAAVFAASAKTATACALSGMVVSGVSSGLVKAYQTGGDLSETIKSASVAGSEGFKWGAICGAISGGLSEAISIHAASASQAAPTIPSPRESELNALSQYGGSEQISFLGGKEVKWGTPYATRPDIVRTVGNHIEAIEVKNYDLATNSKQLITEFRRQISQRATDLPEGSTQRIVLDVTGRGYSANFIQSKIAEIQEALADIYRLIPIKRYSDVCI